MPVQWEVPQPRQHINLTLEDGCHVLIRRFGNGAGVRLVLAHGNGFAADAYQPFWRLLVDEFDVVLFDFRNHGHSGTSDLDRHNYDQLAADLEHIVTAIGENFGPAPTVGVFHSLSARVASKHAVDYGPKWSALVLFDPSSIPPRDHALYEATTVHSRKLARWALRQRSRFNDPEELAAEYASLRTAARWVSGAHQLVARSVLRRESDTDTWSLVCAPEAECTLYEQARELDLWPTAHQLGGNVLLVGADPELPEPAWTAISNRALARDGGYDYVTVPGSGHFLQLEDPAVCARLLREHLVRCKVAQNL